MNNVCHWFAGWLLAGVCAVFGVSCASASQETQESNTAASEATKPAPEVPETAVSGCADSAGEPKHCTTNEECCSGFVCSLDPERSHVTRYCLEG